MRFIVALFVGLAVAVLATSPAGAQEQVVAPPGNSGVDEYLEVVPAAGGDKPVKRPGSAEEITPVAPSAALGPAATTELERLGADGQAAANAAAAGVPARNDREAAVGRSANGKLSAEGIRPGRSIVAGDSRGRVSTIATALTGDSGGMGLVFPLLLGGTFVVAIALLGARSITRRR